MSSLRKSPDIFFSLKWKIMALLGLVFVTLTLLLIGWAYLSQAERL